MSTKKKVILGVFGVLLVAFIGVVGVAAKIYFDVKSSANDTYASAERSTTLREETGTTAEISEQEPFSVLLLGIDTGALGRDEQGRSDTMILATVNPQLGQTTMISLERDTYTEIVGHGTTEKLNSAYAYGGVAMAMDTVENLLSVPVDHYITINMAGLEELVDAVGGITVNNSFTFDYEGTNFSIGTINLNGEDALKYSRMRYDDPNGNYGRQERQRKVIAAIAQKVLSFSGVTEYQSILNAISSNMTTDFTFDEMTSIALNYRNSFTNIVGDQLQGTGFMQDGVSYQSVSAEEIARVKAIADEQLGITE
ncbi:LCP family protein [Enterococcus sp. HY326]|uniref:LCP family glycopolymer transferase n=1 Tax=Enterococcus sp. HY326 TaxID=2971265 RepID=UPI00223F4468|nr:LCP family protein [Enterococcus sp. HY326]